MPAPPTSSRAVSGAWAPQAYLKASNAETDDRFGWSVAIDGDTIAVGAIYEDSASSAIVHSGGAIPNNNSASQSGAVYIFTRTGGVWTQQAYLKAAHPDDDDYFGYSVALSGNTLVVGVEMDDSDATGVNGDSSASGASASGAAYVFVRVGGTWIQQAYLKASNTGFADFFGQSVAISGDTIVVGAFGEDSSVGGVDGDGADNAISGSGAAYIFTRSGGFWGQAAYLKAADPGEHDSFGYAVDTTGDFVVVGSYREDSGTNGIVHTAAETPTDNGANQSGAVYVFARDAGESWYQQAYVKAPEPTGGDSFGQSVSASGERFAVGGSYEDSAATGIDGDGSDNSAKNSGATWIFVNEDGVWSDENYLKAPNSETWDEFGFDVALDGDTVVVAANGEDSSATGVDGDQTDNSFTSSGAAYAYRLAESEAAVLVPSLSPLATSVLLLTLGFAGWGMRRRVH